jgi:hypothetical protein
MSPEKKLWWVQLPPTCIRTEHRPVADKRTYGDRGGLRSDAGAVGGTLTFSREAASWLRKCDGICHARGHLTSQVTSLQFDVTVTPLPIRATATPYCTDPQTLAPDPCQTAGELHANTTMS